MHDPFLAARAAKASVLASLVSVDESGEVRRKVSSRSGGSIANRASKSAGESARNLLNTNRLSKKMNKEAFESLTRVLGADAADAPSSGAGGAEESVAEPAAADGSELEGDAASQPKPSIGPGAAFPEEEEEMPYVSQAHSFLPKKKEVVPPKTTTAAPSAALAPPLLPSALPAAPASAAVPADAKPSKKRSRANSTAAAPALPSAPAAPAPAKKAAAPVRPAPSAAPKPVGVRISRPAAEIMPDIDDDDEDDFVGEEKYPKKQRDDE